MWRTSLPGVFHLVQSVVFLFIVTDFALPITTSFPTEDPALIQGAPPVEVWTDFQLGYGVAAFSLLSAFFHFLVSTVAKPTYERAIANRQNPFRWIEYSVSATVMMVLIVMLLGDYDIGALIAVAGVNASMILFGWLMERTNDPGDESLDWYPFVFGCIAGIVPWIVGAIYFAGALSNADEAIPPWVWVVFFSVFALFNVFAINQFLQYKVAALRLWRGRVHRVVVRRQVGADVAGLFRHDPLTDPRTSSTNLSCARSDSVSSEWTRSSTCSGDVEQQSRRGRTSQRRNRSSQKRRSTAGSR